MVHVGLVYGVRQVSYLVLVSVRRIVVAPAVSARRIPVVPYVVSTINLGRLEATD